jgi:hypothetical protein
MEPLFFISQAAPDAEKRHPELRYSEGSLRDSPSARDRAEYLRVTCSVFVRCGAGLSVMPYAGHLPLADFPV